MTRSNTDPGEKYTTNHEYSLRAIDWFVFRSAMMLSFETPRGGGRIDHPARTCYEKCPARARVDIRFSEISWMACWGKYIDCLVDYRVRCIIKWVTTDSERLLAVNCAHWPMTFLSSFAPHSRTRFWNNTCTGEVWELRTLEGGGGIFYPNSLWWKIRELGSKFSRSNDIINAKFSLSLTCRALLYLAWHPN